MDIDVHPKDNICFGSGSDEDKCNGTIEAEAEVRHLAAKRCQD